MNIKVTYSNSDNNLDYLYQIFIRIIEQDQAHQNKSYQKGDNNEKDNSILQGVYESSRPSITNKCNK